MRDSSVVKVCAVPAEELCLVSSIHVSKLIHPGGSDSSWISGHCTQVNIALSPGDVNSGVMNIFNIVSYNVSYRT